MNMFALPELYVASASNAGFIIDSHATLAFPSVSFDHPFSIVYVAIKVIFLEDIAICAITPIMFRLTSIKSMKPPSPDIRLLC